MKDQSRTNKELLEKNAFLKKRIQELEQSESERKRVEEALQKSEDRYRQIAEGLRAFVHRVDQLMYQGKKNGKERVCCES